ncbi:low choriolytic enzyme-like [Poecilia reticulata]|uniref:low choriolytic enzyme-like n=1 Tax=Poecilia reticulata TaxID=8081 RepID=UPI0004A4AFAE|nr:PREDICTED: low choriolytic enzyme-like [Poecilia reticulata]
MTPNVLCLLFLLMADMSLSAPAKNEDPVKETANSLETIPRPRIDFGKTNFEIMISRSRCLSNVGRQNGGQYISLERPGCVEHGTVQHEVLHALGFHHEQSRSDRDKYVWIRFQNIEEGAENQFKKVATHNLGTPYDFFSVMQYEKYAFSKNKKPTIVAKFDPNFDWGRAYQMSANDIDRVNRLYGC